ncbi:HAD family hydrolase [Chloroflexi bacterium TSY]|nr:HAD family hydrolase [Chloroflexi bacterium TSY]
MKQSEPPFDLIILDLDGTILDPYHSTDFSLSIRKTISAVQSSGIPVTIGTGRTFGYVQEYARMLNITTPVLTTQGAVIGDPVNGRVLAETLMPLDAARQVAQWVDETQRITVFYFTSEEGEVAIYQNHEQHKDASIDNDFFDHVFGDHRVLYPNFTQLLAADQMRPPVKFISINDAEKEEDIVSDLKVRFAPQLYITRTHPQLVEGTAQGVDKGSGVLRLCELLDVAPQRVLAIGDSDNDIPMLETVGFAVAMGNASAGVKAVADWIAPSIDDDGAAVALNKFVLGP